MNFNLDQNAHDLPEIEEAVIRVIRSRQYLNGPEIGAFESEIALRTENRFPVAVGSGTDALYVSLRALGIGPGDEVITSAFGVAYTALAIQATGATPVFADVNPLTLAMDPTDVESRITPHTRGIVPVHFFGYRGDVRPYREIAAARGLVVLEDAAQVSPQSLGASGDVVAFSCYPTKNLGAIGEAGILVTNIPSVAFAARRIRDSGRIDHYRHTEPGLNMVMDEVQAAVLRVKLKTLTARDHRRIDAAQYYVEKLLPGPMDVYPIWNGTYVPHLFVLHVGSTRDRLMQYLTGLGIPTLIHYPIAVPDQPVFSQMGDWPNARAAADSVLSIPFHPDITREDQDRVITGIRNFYTAP